MARNRRGAQEAHFPQSNQLIARTVDAHDCCRGEENWGPPSAKDLAAQMLLVLLAFHRAADDFRAIVKRLWRLGSPEPVSAATHHFPRPIYLRPLVGELAHACLRSPPPCLELVAHSPLSAIEVSCCIHYVLGFPDCLHHPFRDHNLDHKRERQPCNRT